MLGSDINETSRYQLEIKNFEGEDLSFILSKDGRYLIPIKSFAAKFDITLGNANKTINAHKDVFKGKVVKVKSEDILTSTSVKQSISRFKTFDCFTISGALEYITHLDYLKYDEARYQYVVNIRRWLTDLGESQIICGPRPAFDKALERAESKIYHKEHMQAISVNYQKRKGKVLTAQYPYIRGPTFANKKAFGFHVKGMRDHATGAGLNRLNAIINRDIPLLFLSMKETEREQILDEIDMYVEKSDVPLLEQSIFLLSDRSNEKNKDQTALDDFINN